MHYRCSIPPLAVLHHDGYLEIRERSKDIIISGGENVCSVEVEAALASHPAVLEVAVVAKPDPKWGERPIAWVKEDATATPDELRRHVRTTLAAFKVPDDVVFAELPKTTSGKVRKPSFARELAAMQLLERTSGRLRARGDGLESSPNAARPGRAGSDPRVHRAGLGHPSASGRKRCRVSFDTILVAKIGCSDRAGGLDPLVGRSPVVDHWYGPLVLGRGLACREQCQDHGRAGRIGESRRSLPPCSP